MDSEIIIGKRISLRPITDADTEMVLEWRNSDRTVRNFYYRKPVTEEDHKRWLKEKVSTGAVWQYIVHMNDSREPVGCVFLQHIDLQSLTGETGVFFSDEAPSGQGIATEAVKLIGEKIGFEKLGLLHLTAKVMKINEASHKLHERAGYHIYKEVSGDKCSDGEIVDSLWFKKDAPLYNVGRKPLLKAKTGKISLTSDGLLSVAVPGSKSITNRALLAAMLAKGESCLNGVLFSDDTESFLKCMLDLGIKAEADRNLCTVRVTGCGGDIPNKKANLNVGSAGTAARFLTAVLGLSESGEFSLDSSNQMKKRPMKPLLDALVEMGCEVEYEGEEGFFPFTLRPHGFKKNEVAVNIEKSSQFLSALMIASPLAKDGMKINVTGIHGLSYVEMTGKIMRSFGSGFEKLLCGEESGGLSTYVVNPSGYTGTVYDIEPDASAACYFAAMSPLIGKNILLKGLHENSMQGDTGFIGILESLGMETAEDTDEGMLIIPEGFGQSQGTMHRADESQNPYTINMSSCSDQTITLAAIAPYIICRTKKGMRITGISHIRLQESDRIRAIVTELQRLGAGAREEGDDIVIASAPGCKWICPADASQTDSAGAVTIRTYDDHRMAMGFSLAGLYIPGVIIDAPGCCSKTFPDYFAYLDELSDL